VTPWGQCRQIVAAPAGWFAVHADRAKPDLDGTMAALVSLRPIACFGLFERLDSCEEPFQAIVARDYSYGGVPSGFTIEDEAFDFIGYLAPGIDLELFRGPALDHYEQKTKARAT
jgi:hypothetical protein